MRNYISLLIKQFLARFGYFYLIANVKLALIIQNGDRSFDKLGEIMQEKKMLVSGIIPVSNKLTAFIRFLLDIFPDQSHKYTQYFKTNTHKGIHFNL